MQIKAMATTSFVTNTKLHKFALQTFNRLAYEQEVSRFLII